MNTNTYKAEILKNQSKKIRILSQYFHTTPYNLCHFANYIHLKTFYMRLAKSHPLKEPLTTHQEGTKHCSIYSLLYTRLLISVI